MGVTVQLCGGGDVVSGDMVAAVCDVPGGEPSEIKQRTSHVCP